MQAFYICLRLSFKLEVTLIMEVTMVPHILYAKIHIYKHDNNVMTHKLCK